jgi:hypothetical protein
MRASALARKTGAGLALLLLSAPLPAQAGTPAAGGRRTNSIAVVFH